MNDNCIIKNFLFLPLDKYYYDERISGGEKD